MWFCDAMLQLSIRIRQQAQQAWHGYQKERLAMIILSDWCIFSVEARQ